MAYTAPTTRITGDVITSGHWNTDLTSNIAWLATDKPMVRANNAGTQSISNNSWTALTFDSEDFDNATIHSTSSNTSRLTFATAGKYLVGGASVSGQASGTDYDTAVALVVGGATYIARSTHAGVTANYIYPSIASVYAFAATNYVELFAWHQFGSDINWGEQGANSEPSNFWAVWLGTN